MFLVDDALRSFEGTDRIEFVFILRDENYHEIEKQVFKGTVKEFWDDYLDDFELFPVVGLGAGCDDSGAFSVIKSINPAEWYDFTAHL